MIKRNRINSIILSILLTSVFQPDSFSQTGFITTWNTTNSGPSGNNQIQIPAIGSYDIYWEEMGNQSNNGTQVGQDEETITFPNSGVYLVEITGDLERMNFNLQGDKWKIQSIESWGDISWTSMENAFAGCFFMSNNAVDAPDLSNVSNCSTMLGGCNSFQGDLLVWDVSNVSDMSFMFSGCGTFNGDLCNWNTSNVTNMRSMFSGSSLFNRDIGAWDVSQVVDMGDMFGEAESFNQDIGGWDVSSVNTMNSMFDTAYGFNQDVSGWNVGSVTDMSFMFFFAESFNQNLGFWDMTSVSDVTDMFDFAGLSVLNYDALLLGWSSQSLIDNLTFGASGRYFCAGETARDSIISQHNWNIQDQGLSIGCDPNNFVINTNNTGAGSLRNAIDNTASNTIYFSPIMSDSTIFLEDDQLVISDSLNIVGVPGGTTIIDGSSLTEIFSLSNTAHYLSINDLSLLVPNETGLHSEPNVDFNLQLDNIKLDLPSSSMPLQIESNVVLNILGVVEIIKN